MKNTLINIKIKRFLAVLLTVVMLVGITPVPALAEQDVLSVEQEISLGGGQGNHEDLEEPDVPDGFNVPDDLDYSADLEATEAPADPEAPANPVDQSVPEDPEAPEDPKAPADPKAPKDSADPENQRDPGIPGDPDDLLETILTLMEAGADISGGDNNGGDNNGGDNNGANELPDFGDADFAEDQIIIVFENAVVNVFSGTRASEDLMQETLEEGLAELPGELDDVIQLDGGAEIIATVELPDDITVEEAILEYEQNPLVKYAQPNFIYYLQDDRVSIDHDPRALIEDTVAFNLNNISFPLSTAWRPNDQLIGSQMALGSASHLDRIRTFEAWELLHPLIRSKVKVAVIDTQIQFNHPDLTGRIRTDLAVNIQSNTLSNESLWRNLTPHDYHGTHVAGLIGATSNNGIGSAGVAAGRTNNIVEIIPINVFEWNASTGKYDTAYTSSSVRALDYAVRPGVGAQVINMSLGGASDDSALGEAVTRAHNAGAVVVASAGNTGNTSSVYPSDYANTISVINVVHTTNGYPGNPIDWLPKGWVDWRTGINPRSNTSSYGPHKNISAPGSFIWSTVPTDLPADKYSLRSGLNPYHPSYDLANGTSMASPVLAGVAALVLFANPKLTPAQVADILYLTATDVHDPGRDDQTGHGVVNAEEAVKIALETGIALDKSGTAIFTPRAFGYAAQTPQTVTVTNTGNQATGALSVALSGTNAGSFTLSGLSIPSIASGGTATFTVVPNTGLAIGTYTAMVTVSGTGTVKVGEKELELPFYVSFNVSFTVNRIAGAAISAAPVVSGKPTHNSMTVAAAAISGTNPGGQTVEYAITTSTSSTLPTGLKWQAGTTFTGLAHTTTYRVWARTAQKNNYSAGTAVRSAAIATQAGTFIIALDKSGTRQFPGAAYGYGAQKAETATVTSTGNQASGALSVALSGKNAGSFTLSRTSISSIASGKTATFTVVPKKGLPAGTHTATVTVSRAAANANSITARSFTVKFVVAKGAGTAVDRAPAASAANRTTTSIKVNDNVMPKAPNPGGQALQFAITTSNSTTAPSSLKWQKSRAFTGLKPLTTYYIWARSAANNNCNAGTARRSAAIATLAPDFGIALSRTGLQTFAPKAFNYAGQPAALSVTVNNIGKKASGGLTVTLSGTQGSRFTLSKETLPGMAPGGKGSFTVRPDAGLGIGVYNATVTVKGTNADTGKEFKESFTVRFTVVKAAGAAVSRAPAAGAANRRPTGITVNDNVLPKAPNPGKQTLQFAITTSSSTTMPTGLKWQSGRAFNGLKPLTKYYIWARTAPNSNYDAGAARRSAAIATLAPAHCVTLNRTGTHTFAAAAYNYGTRTALSVKVRNIGSEKKATGALKVEIIGTNGTNPKSFVLSAGSLTSIAPSATKNFTVKPAQGLPVRVNAKTGAIMPYTATIRVRGNNGILAEFNVSFRVNK